MTVTIKETVKEGKIGQTNEQESQFFDYLRKKEKEHEENQKIRLVNDFLHKKLNEEKTYFVNCNIKYVDQDEYERSETYSVDFECYVNANTDSDAISKVESIFSLEYQPFDNTEIKVWNSRTCNGDEIIEFVKRKNLHKKYNFMGDDYILYRNIFDHISPTD